MQPHRRANALKGIAVGLASIVMSWGGATATAQEKLILRLDFTPAGTHAAPHLANQKGWFKEQGLEVDVQDGRGSINSIQLVGAGQADFGWVALGSMAMAREQGMNVKGVAGIFRKGDLAIMVDEKSNVRTPKDLAGKKLVLFTGSPWMPFLDYFFKNAGMSRSDVNIVFVDPTAMFPNYASGQSDAVASLGPFALPIINVNRPSRQILAADYGIAFPAHGILVREELIAKRPETVQKFVTTVLRAWNYVLAGKEDEGVDAVIAARSNAKLDRNVLRQQLELYRAHIDTPHTKGKPLGWQTDEDWTAAIKTMEAAGVIKGPRKPSDYYTNQFIKEHRANALDRRQARRRAHA
jgi:NitT/TauT family transport system substrate-binding protein